MDDGGRYSIQLPSVSNLPPTRPTLPPPLTRGCPGLVIWAPRPSTIIALLFVGAIYAGLTVQLFRPRKRIDKGRRMNDGPATPIYFHAHKDKDNPGHTFAIPWPQPHSHPDPESPDRQRGMFEVKDAEELNCFDQ